MYELDASPGNTTRPTSSTGFGTLRFVTVPHGFRFWAHGQSADRSARTPAFAQSSLVGLDFPGTDALQLLPIEPVVSRTTMTSSGCGTPPLMLVVEVAVMVIGPTPNTPAN